MTKFNIFSREEKLLEGSQEFLNEHSELSQEVRDAFELLLTNYQKNIRNIKKMTRISDKSEAELNRLNEEMRKKRDELAEISSNLAKYLSPQIYERIFSGNHDVSIRSGRKKLTVFFSDIVGFTDICEQLEPEELSFQLNNYLQEMTKIALEHGATVDKYIGDAIMIFFGDPESKGTKEDALACVQMAIKMRDCLREMELNSLNNNSSSSPFRVRMGISTDYCTVGNFGADNRMDYTIIGRAVNLASRLESLAETGEIMLSAETERLIRKEVQCEPCEALVVKGFARPVQTYRVIGLIKNHKNIQFSGGNNGYHYNILPEQIAPDEKIRLATELERIAKQIRESD